MKKKAKNYIRIICHSSKNNKSLTFIWRCSDSFPFVSFYARYIFIINIIIIIINIIIIIIIINIIINIIIIIIVSIVLIVFTIIIVFVLIPIDFFSFQTFSLQTPGYYM